MSQILMIILISLLVLVHEAGHFIAARLTGVRVTRFGIGMPIGPSFKLFKWQNTTFYIHAFLFGGYVAFADDEPKEEENNNKEDDEETLPSDSAELYENKTIFQKLFIVSAGVIMNIVFAIFLVILCAIFFQKLPTQNQNLYVDSFQQKASSNLYQKDIKKGDRIVKINNTKINNLYQMQFFAKNSKLFDDFADENLINLNLEELQKLNPNLKNEIPKNTLILLPKTKEENALTVNKNVLEGLEKYKKQGKKLTEEQIKLRDEIYSKSSFKSSENLVLEDVAYALSDTYKPAEVTILRDGKEIVLNNVIVDKTGLFGVVLRVEDVYAVTKTPKDIVLKSISYCYTTTKTMLFSLWQLFTGKVNVSEMHGVIAVVKVGGDIIASKGILNGILLTAMISINLAIMNFLPIPALDGGHVLFLIIEQITGKKPDKEFADKITNFFFMLLILLMIAICYNDVFALVTKKF